MRLGSVPILATLVALLLALAPPAAADFPAHARVERQAETGKVGFVGTRPGRPIPRPAGFSAASPPAAVGKAFLERHAKELGLAAAAAVRSTRTSRQPAGVTAVRYQQSVEGVDVLGGEFVVQLDSDNNVLSVLGEALPNGDVATSPGISRQDAERRAIASVARAEHVHAARLTTRDVALRIFDNRLLGGPGLDRPALVWAVRVVDGAGTVRRLALVDAQLGVVAVSIDETTEALNRTVCDAENQTAAVPCDPAHTVLTEGQAATVGADAQAAYDFSGATYDFFQSRFGRDSVDGRGMPLVSTVRFCAQPSDCPYENAFWNGEQMVYGEGFSVADDVVAHELAHGFTQFTSGLFYIYQSGAINESLSDVFGELVDQVTRPGSDAPADKWLLGEDLAVGAIRSMSNPPAYGDPDSMTSPHFDVDDSFADNGGVHANSGVNNKAAFLISDGGAFGGQTLTGIGLEKTARVYYAVATGFLTSASDYRDLGLALGQACRNLLGTSGITDADCAQVDRAVLATAMLTERQEAKDDVECPPGQRPHYVFSDSLEGSVNWSAQPGSAWFLPQNAHGGEFDATYATSGVTNMWGYNVGQVADYSMVQNSAVAVPADAFLSFAHSYLFERFESSTYDGGVVEYSTDGGATWTNAIPTSRYTGTIDSRFGNPLGGRAAFVGTSHGYRTMVVPITGLGGRSAKFRFRMGTDQEVDDYGWFIDDVRIGTCVVPGHFTLGSSSAAEAGSSAIVVTRPAGAGLASVRLATTGGTATPGVDYTPVSTVIEFTGAQTTATVPISIVDDSGIDPGETIEFALSDPVNGDITGATGAVTIQDNDVQPIVEPPPLGKLTAKRASVRGKRIRLRFAVPAAGRLRVTGRVKRVRLKPVRATATEARTVAVTVRIPAKVQRLRRRRALIARFTATFRPSSGATAQKVRASVRLPRRR